MFTNETLKAIYLKTDGHCHFCGDRLILKKYGWKEHTQLNGAWEVDHVIQKGKGGITYADNCLPACVRCNRLRWHRKGNDLREVIFLGLIATDQIKKKTAIGKDMLKLKKHRLKANIKRRRKIQSPFSG